MSEPWRSYLVPSGMLEFFGKLFLVAYMHKSGNASVMLGVKRTTQVLYDDKTLKEVALEDSWLWGFAREPCDASVRYFGLGPFVFVTWVV